ncbi:MAG: arginase family protein [Pseudomonadota bacterium]
MQLFLLHLDDALLTQPGFIASCERSGGRALDVQTEGSAIRLWGKDAALTRLRDRLRDGFADTRDEPKLCFMGSGDFHHVTSLLLDTTLAATAEPITIIHFDNHPDWVHFKGGAHCGSWVNRAAAHPAVSKIITIGVASNDLKNPDWKGANLNLMRDGMLELYPFERPSSRVRHAYGEGASHRQSGTTLHWQTMQALGEQNFIDTVLARIPTRGVYITIDKDVLAREDAETNWDQGHMRMDYLLHMLRSIGRRHRIVGADVTGDYSRPHYSGNLFMRAKKNAEIFLDQPRPAPSPEDAARVNSLSNLALLEMLQGVMA